MNKSESKYFNTAKLMNEALLILLEKKEIESITVKEICDKAGVNRSTFYLHYDSIDDLFVETVEMLNLRFKSYFISKDVRPLLKSGAKEDLFFITEEFLIPYLEFVNHNKRVFKIVHKKPVLFKNDKIYNQMCEEIFFPIISKFGVKKEERVYILEYFTKGTVGIINKWLDLDCKTPVKQISELIIDCIGYKV
jgi:hypothetical protein